MVRRQIDYGPILRGFAETVSSSVSVQIKEVDRDSVSGRYLLQATFPGGQKEFYPYDLVPLSEAGQLLGLSPEKVGQEVYFSPGFNLYSGERPGKNKPIEYVDGLSLLYLAGRLAFKESQKDECSGIYHKKWAKGLVLLKKGYVLKNCDVNSYFSTVLKRQRGNATLEVVYPADLECPKMKLSLLRFVPRVAAIDNRMNSLDKVADSCRPKVFSECEPYLDCCPFWSCFYNTSIDVSKSERYYHGKVFIKERLMIYHPDAVDWQAHSKCSLAPSVRRQSLTLEEIGAEMGVTRELVRQIETKALGRLKKALSEDTDSEQLNMALGLINLL